jgi:hypothetical protein
MFSTAGEQKCYKNIRKVGEYFVVRGMNCLLWFGKDAAPGNLAPGRTID